MLVDLARNDVRRVTRPGSVRVEEFMNVLKYSHVQHIESTVTDDPDRVTVQAGTGIVADSDPAAKYEETDVKMDGVLEAIERMSFWGWPSEHRRGRRVLFVDNFDPFTYNLVEYISEYGAENDVM